MMEFNKAYNREEFLQFLRVNFLPEDFIEQNDNVNLGTQKYTQSAVKLGVCKSLDLVVYEIKHSGKEDPRVGLSKEAFRLLANEWQSCALVLFVPKDNNANYRFSLITIELKEGSKGKAIREYSNPRRYSYLLGEGIGGYTPNKYLAKGQIKDKKDLTERFSVEILTKAFYNELSDWYAWAIETVVFPGEQDMDTTDKRNEHRSKNVIRLLTRLLFVWFLKQKELIPWQLFDEEYISNNLLEDFNPNLQTGLFKEKSVESVYYKAILQNLFFATLNCPIIPQNAEDKRERGFRKNDWYGQGFGQDHLMRYETLFSYPNHFIELVNEKVPFLNGGLFDCLDDKEHKIYIDGFSDNMIKPNQLIVPDYLFFGEIGKGQDLSYFYGDKKKKSTDVYALLDILKKYNFTIEENMPFDQEVSLDPELLGKVFENLLASYNPETKTTARKQTGSFYTPREIVQYMVDESLVTHLRRTVGKDLEDEFRKLTHYTDEELSLNDEQKKAIIHSLQNCKVLDPACGSGAFPVGILQQMVHILSQLDSNNDIWKNLILEESVRELGTTLKDCTVEERKEIQADINRNFDDSINRPDYARKLYLIEKCIYGIDIQSIAVQISKLRFFISLVVDQKPTNDRCDNFGIRPLPNLEAKFVAANTLIGLNKGDRTLFDDREIDRLQEKLIQASHRIFGAKSNKTKNRYKARVEELQGKIAEKLETLGVVGNEDARLMRQWKMFDQNASSPFFDPEWMFGISKGFDIVIANPPFVFTRDVEFSGDFKKYIEIEYFSKVSKTEKKSKAKQSGKINLFAVFIMKGAMLNIKGGVLTYIVPNNILRTTTYDNVRKYILENTNIEQIVDLGSGIFDNVTASTIILQLSNIINKEHSIKSITHVEDIEQHKFEISNIPQNQFKNNTSYTFNIFGDNAINSVLNKIENNIIKLGEKCIFISPGIDGDKNKYVSSSQINEKYKPLLYGKNIKRYNINFDNNFILYDKKLLNRSRSEIIFKSNKIITQRISGGEKPIVAAIDNGEFYTFNSVNNIVLKDNSISLSTMVALLNSNTINWYYANKFSNNSKLTVNISKTYLEMLPIPNISKYYGDKIDILVEEIMNRKKNGLETEYLENKIDLLVYKLYDLTFDEMLIIDPQSPINKNEYEQYN